MTLTPVIAIHMSAALAALALGPFALWSRMGARQRPRLHRLAGYVWVVLMMVAAVSALFIRDVTLPNIAGFTPIHLLIPATGFGVFWALWKVWRGEIRAHRRAMQYTYVGACLIAGAFTLLPGRLLGQLVWGRWMGVL